MKSNNRKYRTAIDLGASVAIISILGLSFYLIPNYDCVVPITIKAILILIAGWLILSFTHQWFKKIEVKLLAFVLLFGYGVFVYWEYATKNNPVDKVLFPLINNALSVFFPSKGTVGEEFKDLDKMQSLHIFHLLALLYFAMIVFSIWGRRAINRARAFLYLRCQKKVFWGESEQGYILAKDIINQTLWQKVVFCLPNSTKEDEEREKNIFEKIDSMGGAVRYCDLNTIKKVPAARSHFFLTEDQDWNVKAALEVIDNLNKRRIIRKAKLYVRTEREGVDRYFDKRNKNTEVKFFSQSDLTARQFVEKHPMLNCPGININTKEARVEGEFNLLLLGFGWQGRELLNKTICDAQFAGSSFRATIIDKDYEAKYGDYPLLYNECIEEYKLKFNPEGCGSVSSVLFYQWIKDNVSGYNRIIVAMGEEGENIDVALKIAKLRSESELGLKESNRVIMAYVKSGDKYRYYNDKKKSPITIFGDLDEIYTHQVVVNEKMDRIAKMVNYFYCEYKGEKRGTPETEWQELSIFHQDSNRAVAMNIDNTFRLIGKDWKRLESLIEVLAETEHLRWNAFHYVSGVRRWELSVVPENCGDAKKKDDEYHNLTHQACLCLYADLWMVSEHIKSDREYFQEHDRRIVRNFPKFIEQK